jgi:hypothetical protein
MVLFVTNNKFKPALSDDEISMIETPKGNWSIARQYLQRRLLVVKMHLMCHPLKN